MEAVLWLEEYLSSWNKILFFVCHSQDFMNNVCTHIVRLDQTYKKLRYYSGNYDMYVQLRRDQDMVQIRQYEAEVSVRLFSFVWLCFQQIWQVS
jgi:ATP-binding cassette, subfamily F, member 2